MNQPMSGAEVDASPAGPPRQAIANTVPVGVAGFALTTFTLGLYNSGHLHTQGSVLVLALAAFYGGLTQFIAGFFALRRGDLFPATFMTTYGAFWWSYVALLEFVVPRVGTAANQAITVFLTGWLIITFIFLLTTLFINWVLVFIFLEFVVTLLVATIANAHNSVGGGHAAGWLEIVLGILGWYAVASELINGVAGRDIFPFPLTPLNPNARAARTGGAGKTAP